MSLQTLDLNPPPPSRPPLILPPVARYPRILTKAFYEPHLPVRGLLYSFILHEIAIGAMMFIPPLLAPRHPNWPKEKWEATMIPKGVLYLPQLGGGSEGGSPKKARDHASPSPKGPAPVASPPGVSFGGNQEIVSNPPNPTNHIQTILQPDLPKPPTLKGFVPLPNMVLLAKALPPPPPAPKPVSRPKPAEEAVEQPPSKPVETPKATETPPQPPVQKAAFIPQVPKITLTGTQPVEAPHLTLPETPVAASRVPLPNALAPPPPEPPAPPEKAAEAKPAPAEKTAETPPEPSVKAPETTPVAARPQALPVGASRNTRNLLVLSAAPALGNAHASVPKGEARGQFAISRHPSPDHSLPGAGAGVGSAKGLGVGSSTGPTVASAAVPGGEGTGGGGGGGNGGGSGAAGGGTGTGTGGHGGVGTGKGSGTGGGKGEGAGTGTGPGAGHGTGTGHGTGSGAGAGPGASPFAGMTIQGAEGPAGGIAISGASNPPTENRSGGSYGLTIVSTGNSGGGVGDFGVFRDEAVFTVYLNPSNSADDPAPPWALQYAVLDAAGSLQDLVPPYPVKKETPAWPSDLLTKYRGQEMVVSGVINAEGKMQHLKVLQSPNASLSEVLLAVLDHWLFRPAAMNGRPVAVKAVLGVPISAVR